MPAAEPLRLVREADSGAGGPLVAEAAPGDFFHVPAIVAS